MRKSVLLFGICWIVCNWSLQGQPNELGFPYLQNYGPKAYQGHPQNFSIVQDKRGLIYFGNKEGVFQYDGRQSSSAWNYIRLRYQSGAYSLAIDDSGTVFIGGNKEIGFLKPDSVGRLAYQTLTDKLPPAISDFGRVWSTQVTPDGVYFQADKYLIRYDPKNVAYPIRIWEPKTSYFLAFKAFNELYIHDIHYGLCRVEGDSVALAPDGIMLAGIRLYAITPFDAKRVLVATRDMGFFLYDGKKFEPFPTQIDAFIAEPEKQLHHARLLADSTIAVATLKGGVVIIDRNGRVKQVLDKKVGLLNQEVYVVLPDIEGGLWLGLGNGLARIEAPSILTRLNDNYHLNGITMAITRHYGHLYVATSQGVFYSEAQATIPELPEFKSIRFKSIDGIFSECLAFLETQHSLLAAGKEGVFEIIGNKARYIWPGYARCLIQSQKDSSIVYVGLTDGIAVLKHSAEGWRALGRTNQIQAEIRSLAEAEDGSLWAATNDAGVMVVDFSKGFDPQPIYKHYTYDSHADLPSNALNVVFKVQNEVVIATQAGLRIFDKSKNKFIPYTRLGTTLAGAEQVVYKVVVDNAQQLWIAAKSYILNQRAPIQHLYRAVLQPNNQYIIERVPSDRFLDFEIAGLFPEANGVVWIGGDEDLVRYETSSHKNFKSSFQCLIRNVETQALNEGETKPDEIQVLAPIILFGGNFFKSYEFPDLPFKQNSVRFDFAAISFDNAAANQYQYWLELEENQQNKWSPWSKESYKEFTNLYEGRYRLHVRARNIYGVISPETVFEFRIRPPWHRRWWAYGIYLILGGGVVYLAVSLRSRQLRQENLRLEQEVLKRTAKIEEQKEELAQKNVVLESQKHELAEQTTLLENQNEQLEHQKSELAGKNVELARFNDELARNNQLLEEQRKKIEQKQIELEQAYEELQITAEQLNDANISLTRTNIELEHKNDQIVKQQAQIILSEKMGALGEITPVVAHEINTPLGAVRASTQVIQTVVPTILQKIPAILAGLSAQEQSVLWQRLNALKSGSPNLSTREERKYINKIEAELADAGIDNTEEYAEKLVKVGVIEGLESIIPLLKTERADLVIESFHQIGSLWKQINTILNAADKALKLVEQLKKYVEPDKPHPTYTNVVEQIQSVLTLHDYYLRQGIELKVNLQPVPEIKGFQQELTQVWKNIIMDAAYAMDLKGTIEVCTEVVGDEIIVRIIDDGPVLAPEDLNKVFEPGQPARAANGEANQSKSLSVTKDIIQKHFGKIQALSKGNQTEFVIQLPIHSKLS